MFYKMQLIKLFNSPRRGIRKMESCFNPSLNCSRCWVRGKQLFNSTQQHWIKKRTSPGKVIQGIYHTPCVCLNCALPRKVKCQFLQRRGGFFTPTLHPRFVSEAPGSTMPSTESQAVLKPRGTHDPAWNPGDRRYKATQLQIASHSPGMLCKLVLKVEGG